MKESRRAQMQAGKNKGAEIFFYPGHMYKKAKGGLRKTDKNRQKTEKIMQRIQQH